MTHLYEEIARRVDAWRAGGYPCDNYPAIAEILDWALEPETGNLRFLRRPQLRALETFWYLRLVEGTPHVFDLYKRLYPQEENLANLLDSTDPLCRMRWFSRLARPSLNPCGSCTRSLTTTSFRPGSTSRSPRQSN